MRKKTIRIQSLLCLVLCGFTSCLQKELPAKPYQPGDETTANVSMGSDYRWQLYYDLENNKVVRKNLKDVWHLGFEATADGYHVILNGSSFMFAYPTGKTNFATVVIADTTGHKHWDSPTGLLDSTAIGEWKGNNEVYIIDKGYSVDLTHQGYKKVQILSVDEQKYTVKYANMDGSSEKTVMISKDSSYNFAFLALKDEPEVLLVEPPKKDWDIVFSQYTHVYYDTWETYLVTGCLLNRYKTTAFMDSIITFKELNYDRALHYTLSPFINTIGYDWKTVGSTTGGGADYKVHTNMNYIILNSRGNYFKLRFIDFYDNKVKGNPKWEFQKL